MRSQNNRTGMSVTSTQNTSSQQKPGRLRSGTQTKAVMNRSEIGRLKALARNDVAGLTPLR